MKNAVSEDIWDTVTVDGKVFAAPTLLQSYVVFANKDLLEAAGVPIPTGDTVVVGRVPGRGQERPPRRASTASAGASKQPTATC